MEQLSAIMDAGSAHRPTLHEQSVMLLEAASFSPEPTAKSGKIFEWRVYHSPTFTDLQPLFERVGIQPMLSAGAWSESTPTYLIPFENPAARERAWAAFGADEEWIKMQRQCMEQHGQIAGAIEISLWKATSYSPVS